ncbi:PF13274 family protein [Leptospira broomii serovar Hurstbridge str. 5399]|uniref:PF13274 family protein n=1 Tax=Leptospira broomii serovar Hurstbridge str. 5399 TaxID=1049789 RepID=T0FGA5_9LEPT|nr:type II toxin-antitoxin system antitoxin SocA domain-containing protein [Leptospira broomii]EQA46966.1 PF13274 family protein [Leptospira broomii serovar Hurstbridge str. 5399]
MEKLLEVISFILQRSPSGRNRQELAKLIYLADGVFFQKYAKIITGQKYIHLEDSPYAMELNQALLHLKENRLIDVLPKLTETGIAGYLLIWVGPAHEEEIDLNRQEKRILRKVLENFKGKVYDENRVYPNLYENYVITPLFSEIKFNKDTMNTKIHFFKRKTLLNISGKIFKVLFSE